MVKKTLKWMVAPVMAIVLGFCVSSFTDEDESGSKLKEMEASCPSPSTKKIIVCAVGEATCAPSGECP